VHVALQKPLETLWSYWQSIQPIEETWEDITIKKSTIYWESLKGTPGTLLMPLQTMSILNIAYSSLASLAKRAKRFGVKLRRC
jgi:hypothetical protein